MAKQQPRPVNGKVVAITGGARGIGRATAQALVREGARVAIGDLDLELARRTVQEVGGECLALELDVTDRESFTRFVDGVERELGPLDVLINNAGIMPLGDFAEESDETAIRLIDINLHGVITGTKLALARMRPRRTGHIINVASYVGKISPPGGATYVATKHAVVGLTESVYAENKDYGIECSIVMPAVVKTELGSGLTEGRGVKHVEPEEVAQAMVDALKEPRLDVYVPSSLGPLNKVSSLLSYKGQERMAKLFKADRVLLDINHAERAAYEARAAASEPSVAPRPEEQAAAQPSEAEPASEQQPVGAGS